MTTIEALRAWAAGSYAGIAAVELLARSFSGRFARAGHPWIGTDAEGRMWLDGDALRAALGLSGGARRVLALVAALIDEQPLDIVDVVSGLDRHHLDLVLAALAHAGASHEHMSVVLDPDGAAHLSSPGSLHPWPTAATP